MWKFRPIGDYYELLVDGATLYLCKRKDSIVQAVLEDLCDRHNNQVRELLDEMNKESGFVVDFDEAYNNGYTDGKEVAHRQGYEEGYDDGYRRGLADGIACQGKLTL